jgi:hypothetical protein
MDISTPFHIHVLIIACLLAVPCVVTAADANTELLGYGKTPPSPEEVSALFRGYVPHLLPKKMMQMYA